MRVEEGIGQEGAGQEAPPVAEELAELVPRMYRLLRTALDEHPGSPPTERPADGGRAQTLRGGRRRALRRGGRPCRRGGRLRRGGTGGAPAAGGVRGPDRVERLKAAFTAAQALYISLRKPQQDGQRPP